jgi:beta-galactosidase
MKEILFGAAYYDEYMPYDRLDEDFAMMKDAGINTIRIGESTWSTYEKKEGKFDFSTLIRVLEKAQQEGMHVIVGTPTYAIPAWMTRSYPDVLATTVQGRGSYGPRQIMDITHPAFRFYAERIIRKMMEVCQKYSCIIGFQLDNETKYYGTAGNNVQRLFVKYLREQFNDDLDALNHEFGLDYWSNRIDAWEDFEDVRSTINGSLGAEFEKFQRSLVNEYLAWQADIVKEYSKEEQFITQNFDFEWRGYSYGLQPSVNHYHAAKCLSIAGVDIYHPSQDELTGTEISFGGDITRSLKQDNYLVIETQAQGFPNWTPYKGQLRLQAYSHLASGANSVMYWHWHSIHNSFETYWKGLLSHDFAPNETYQEAALFGAELKKYGSHLVNLQKKNDAAILVSNESLTGLKWFNLEATAAGNTGKEYNDVFRWLYDALYQMNIGTDIVWPESENLCDYKVLIVPALYSAPQSLLDRLKDYVKNGGCLLATFKTGFSNEHLKVYTDVQPHSLQEVFGVHYHQFTHPKHVGLKGSIQGEAQAFMELLKADRASVLASYDHFNWKDYAAITLNTYGAGKAMYLGCMMDESALKQALQIFLKEAGISIPEMQYPLIIKSGINDFGKKITYYFNYSDSPRKFIAQEEGIELSENKTITKGIVLKIAPWSLKIVEE